MKPLYYYLVKDWLGRDCDKKTELFGQLRWIWIINHEQFEKLFKEKWRKHTKEIETKLPDWMRGWHCIVVIWPSEDCYQISVILRNPNIDFWCLPTGIRKKHPTYLKLYCSDCNMIREECKCKEQEQESDCGK